MAATGHSAPCRKNNKEESGGQIWWNGGHETLRIDAQAGMGRPGVGGRYLRQGLAGAERERERSGGSGGAGCYTSGAAAAAAAWQERIVLGFGIESACVLYLLVNMGRCGPKLLWLYAYCRLWWPAKWGLHQSSIFSPTRPGPQARPGPGQTRPAHGSYWSGVGRNLATREKNLTWASPEMLF
jgi:hypothetical protein